MFHIQCNIDSIIYLGETERTELKYLEKEHLKQFEVSNIMVTCMCLNDCKKYEIRESYTYIVVHC